MTPDDVIEIFAAASAAYESVSSKPTYTDIDRFDKKVNSILVESPREYNGDEYGMLHLSQDPSECSTLTGRSALAKIGKLAAHDSSINANASDAERKQAEVLHKVKLNDSKVEAAAKEGAKKMLLSTFDYVYANKLKHHIKLYAGASCFELIDHLRKNCRKSHQLNISELLVDMAGYYDMNEGFMKCIEQMKEAQKTASTIDANLINNAALLRLGIEAMHEYSLFEKVLYEWKELTKAQQT